MQTLYLKHCLKSPCFTLAFSLALASSQASCKITAIALNSRPHFTLKEARSIVTDPKVKGARDSLSRALQVLPSSSTVSGE